MAADPRELFADRNLPKGTPAPELVMTDERRAELIAELAATYRGEEERNPLEDPMTSADD